MKYKQNWPHKSAQRGKRAYNATCIITLNTYMSMSSRGASSCSSSPAGQGWSLLVGYSDTPCGFLQEVASDVQSTQQLDPKPQCPPVAHTSTEPSRQWGSWSGAEPSQTSVLKLRSLCPLFSHTCSSLIPLDVSPAHLWSISYMSPNRFCTFPQPLKHPTIISTQTKSVFPCLPCLVLYSHRQTSLLVCKMLRGRWFLPWVILGGFRPGTTNGVKGDDS